MKISEAKVGDILHILLEDHNVPALEDVDGPELTFEAFGRVVRHHARSVVLQTWGYPPKRGYQVPIDKNTEMLRILKKDVVKVRKIG